jgi:hypothetical protein
MADLHDDITAPSPSVSLEADLRTCGWGGGEIGNDVSYKWIRHSKVHIPHEDVNTLYIHNYETHAHLREETKGVKLSRDKNCSYSHQLHVALRRQAMQTGIE